MKRCTVIGNSVENNRDVNKWEGLSVRAVKK